LHQTKDFVGVYRISYWFIH